MLSRVSLDMDRTLDKIEFCKTTFTMTIKPSTESSEPATNPTIGFLVVVAFVVIFVVVVTFVVVFIVGFVVGSEGSVEVLPRTTTKLAECTCLLFSNHPKKRKFLISNSCF